MELLELRNDIKNKKFKSFYVFCGDEWKVQEIYLKRMTDAIGDRVYADSFSDIYSKIKAPSFFKRRTLYIVRDDKDLMTDEKLLEKLESIMAENVLVLLVSSPDKRMKLYRTYKSSFVQFDVLKTANLRGYVKSEIDLDNDNVDTLIDICENNYGRILLEIDKIKRYVQSVGEISHDDAFSKLVVDGTIYEPPEALTDYISEYVIKGAGNSTWYIFDQCKRSGVPSLTILMYLYNSIRDVLQVTTCNSKDVSKSTGLPQWRVQKAKEKVGYRTADELIDMLKYIHKVEVGIKTGVIEDSIAVEYLLINIL